MTRILYRRNARQRRHGSSEPVSCNHGGIRRSSSGKSRRRRHRRRRARRLSQSLQSRTVGNGRIVFFRPRRGALVVGHVHQGALLLVVEVGPVFQVHGDGGDVVEGALAGLVGAGDFDAFVRGERAGCDARHGRCGRRAGGGGGV